MKNLVLILALLVVSCSDSSELSKPMTTYKLKVSGVCSIYKIIMKAVMTLPYLLILMIRFCFMDVQDNTTIDYDSEDYWNEIDERYSQ